jgi:cation:H+ antiporter
MIEVLASIIGLSIAFAILVRGAHIFVGGAQELGTAFGMSAFTTGVFIVGIGASLPEFMLSSVAVFQGGTDIAIASVVGSNIINILLIVGIAALIGGTVHIRTDGIRTQFAVFSMSTALFVLAIFDGVIDRLEALFLVCAFGAYVWYALYEPDREGEDARVQSKPRMQSVGYIIGGCAALIIGAKISIDMVGRLGDALTIPVELISLTVLALGASLPVLLVTVRSIMRREHELALGTIFGANICNMLFVIGILGLLLPLEAGARTMALGIPVMIVASLILVMIGFSSRVKRPEGLMLILFLGFFVVKLVVSL